MLLTWLLIAFLISLVFVLVTIIKFKFHPFLSLLLGGVLMAILSKIVNPELELQKLVGALGSGFGSTMAGIGIVIVWGVVLGQLLHKSGCTEQIAGLMLRVAGEDKSPLAIALTGYLVSIPVFFDAAFVILINLVKELSRKGKVPFVTLVTSLSVGLIATHVLVIPTPGPLAVAGEMGANIGAFFVYGALVALAGVLVAGVVYAKWLGNRPQYVNDFADAFADELDEPTAVVASGEKPSGGLGVFLIFFPIALILIGTLGMQFFAKGSLGYQVFGFFGDKNIALMIGALAAFFALKKYLKDNLEEVITESAKDAGIIFLITGAGGSFGAIINASGLGGELEKALGGMTGASATIVLVLVAWFISQTLRLAQGSATVALILTAGMMAPVVTGLSGVSPLLVGLAICAGGTGISLPNDSGFWVVNRFSRFTVRQTFETWTVGGTIAGVTALLGIVILALLQNILPGMF